MLPSQRPRRFSAKMTVGSAKRPMRRARRLAYTAAMRGRSVAALASFSTMLARVTTSRRVRPPSAGILEATSVRQRRRKLATIALTMGGGGGAGGEGEVVGGEVSAGKV